ncbi:hypothetical protein CFOL_v3_10347 [Cephalotus follicularis]|uniref:Tesmin/TSO1-like CXC domain-containing protein n=1 Tax=Cephalotus follicularis TaxID=3775 RepID=A0A1Q3BFN1_CEPFO|nr:hypothetical protein CFOL_v3_10347 [Cephalotus follicularis]
MKKQNRRSKQTSVAVAESSPSIDDAKQDYGKRVLDLELENSAYKSQIEELRCKLANVKPTSNDDVQELKRDYLQKLNALEEKVLELKKKLNAQPQLSTQKQRNDEAYKQFQDEIYRMKTQKVQLQCKMKLDSMQFRLSKAALEKENLQLKKEQRRTAYEMHKLLALNRMQKLVLQRKTKEAAVATKRVQEMLESRKDFLSQKTSAGGRSGSRPGIQDNQRELDVTLMIQEVCSEYERQIEEMLDEVNNLKLEAEKVEEENSSCLLQDEESDCKVKDSELRELKDEVARLSSLVSHLGMTKPQLIHSPKPRVEQVQSSVSCGSSIDLVGLETSESEHSVGTIVASGKPVSGICCTCSKKSLCKTTKCGCRAAGGSCGTSCGCSASKCSNRQVSMKLDDSLNSEMGENVMNYSGLKAEKSRVLASQGEVLLQSAPDEKPADMIDNHGPRKKPLCDIGNTLVNAARPGPRKQKKTAAS